MTVAVQIAIECAQWESALPDLEALALRVTDVCFETMPFVSTPVDSMARTELSMLFCNDDEIQALNAVWRQQDKPTNVLSFPAGASAPGVPIRLLGDIAIAFETVAREAQAERKTLASHTAHMIAHGLLHLLGYDHETDADADKMEAQERLILAQLGLPDPYGGRDAS